MSLPGAGRGGRSNLYSPPDHSEEDMDRWAMLRSRKDDNPTTSTTTPLKSSPSEGDFMAWLHPTTKSLYVELLSLCSSALSFSCLVWFTICHWWLYAPIFESLLLLIVCVSMAASGRVFHHVGGCC